MTKKWLERIGVSYPLLSWREPRAVAELEWRREGLPECKKFTLLLWKLALVVGLPILLLVRIWLPEGFAPGLKALLLLCVIMPVAVGFLPLWMHSKTGTTCGINRKGLFSAVGQTNSFVAWENIISHRFCDFPNLPSVRMVSVTVQRGRNEFERKFRFDPEEVSEAKIRELIEAHLAQ